MIRGLSYKFGEAFPGVGPMPAPSYTSFNCEPLKSPGSRLASHALILFEGQGLQPEVPWLGLRAAAPANAVP